MNEARPINYDKTTNGLETLKKNLSDLNKEIVEAIRRDDAPELIAQLDEKLKEAYEEISEFVPQTESERKQILDYSLSMIEGNTENDYIIKFFVNIIRKNL